MNTAQDQKYFKIGEAAKQLGLASETLRRWERSGKISFSRSPGGKRLFSEADLEAIRNILKPTHEPIQTSLPSQNVNISEPINHSDKSDRIVLLSIPRLKPPRIDPRKAIVAILVLVLVFENVFIFSGSSYPHKAVLGVETFIAPALEESGPLGNLLSKGETFLSPIEGVFQRFGSFVEQRAGFFALALLGNTTSQTTTVSSLPEGIKVDGNNITLGFPNLGTTTVDNNFEVIGSSQVSDLTVSGTLNAKGSTILQDLSVNNNTSVGGNLSIGGNFSTSGTATIQGTNISGNSLVFNLSSPTIYPSTTNSQISINANGTGAINIGNSSTGDIYFAGGSDHTGCTLTNSDGSFNCAGDLTTAGKAYVNGGTLATGAVSFTLFPSTATSITFAPVATSISIGSSTGTTTINNAETVTGATTLSSTLGVTGATTLTGLLTANGGITDTGNFSQTGTGTFSTGTGAISLNGDTTIASGKNLTLTSGTGQLNQTYTGTTTDASTITASSLTTGNARKIAFTQNSTASAGNTASGLNIVAAVATNTGNTTDLINLSTSGGIGTVNGIDYTGTLSNFTNLINSTNFIVTSAGAETLASNLAVNGGSITTTQTTANLFNATATTLNIGGAATTVSIGNASGTTTVNGNLSVSGVTTNSGNVTLGSSVANTITFTGVVNSNIVPSSTNAYDLGSSSKKWANGYFTNVNASNLAGTVTGGNTTAQTWTINSGNATNNALISAVAFSVGTAPINDVLQWNASGDTTNKITGFDNYNLFNYPIALFSQVSGINQTFTSGSLFKYSQPATHAITQSGAFIGDEIDFSSNITVPNSASGNQTGSKVTLKDGGASATAIGFQTAGTLDYGLDLGGTIGSADIRLSNSATIDNKTNGTLQFTVTTGSFSGALTAASSSITATGTTTTGAAVTANSLTTGNASSITFTNNSAAAAGNTATGLSITENAATNTGNTSNLISLSAGTNGTVNGINISSATGFTNFFKTPTFNLDASGNVTGVAGLTATTLTGSISTASQTNITAVGTLTSLSVTGNINSASGALQTNGVTRIDNSGNITGGTGSFAGAVTPSLDATYDFGSAVLRWNNAYFAGDVTAGDVVFKNKFRMTENGNGIDFLNPKGEKVASIDENGNFWVKGEIKHGN